MCYEKNVMIMQKFIETTIEIDNKLYERVMKKHFDDSRNKVDIYTKNLKKYRKEMSYQSKTINKINYLNLMLIKLNFFQKNKRINLKRDKKKQSKESNKVCYNCDKSNYFARNYRSRSIMSQQQINVLL